MWESPIQIITDDIIKDIVQKEEEWLMESVHRVWFNFDKDELVKALNYDRDQYERGYADGRGARDSEIVRCKDCKHYRDSFPYNTCDVFDAMATDADDFCSYGERKGTEDETDLR